MGVLMERIYWIEYVGGRGRKERLWDEVGIEVRKGVWCWWMMGGGWLWLVAR